MRYHLVFASQQVNSRSALSLARLAAAEHARHPLPLVYDAEPTGHRQLTTTADLEESTAYR